ncbi:arylamine N-acetyltransferase 2 [Pyrenochaeta sp. DS3sAY3a]|nr:arylamine N-acetyltransferase 2 [Pyrenochaeta sp. DS3sAY3a]
MAAPSFLIEDQLSAFLTYIGLPASLRNQRSTGDAKTDLHFLTQLHIHTISTIPYDNLWLHYSATHINTILPASKFTNIVTAARGRGGYCFQVSLLFNHVLRALGFAAYLAPVRIRHRVDGVPHGDFSGWVHLVNLLTLSDGSKWSFDVAFGGDGPTAPVRLVHDIVQTNLGSQQIRLFRDWIPSQLLRTEESKLWVYQYRNGEAAAWNSFYAFGEQEAMEADFGNLNWYTGSHPESFQTFTCIVVKFLRREKTNNADATSQIHVNGAPFHPFDQEIYGKRMLVNGVVKENLGGKTAIVEDCQTEDERVEALEKWFGIRLTEEERLGIKGWGTELRGDGSEGVLRRQAGGKGEVWEFRRGKEWGRVWRGEVRKENGV